MHTHAAILSTGDELLLGQVLDTNARLLADRLTGLGITPIEHATVGDDLPALVATLRRLVDAAPLVIMTGGLGPTDGDLTREALAALKGEPQVEDTGAREALTRRLAARGRDVTERQRRQAHRPASARCLPNAHGTAPGLVMSVASRVGVTDVFALPGPPGELRPMLEEQVVPALRPDPSRVVLTRRLHVVGVAEADAAQRLADLTPRDRSPLVGLTASGAVLTVRIRYVGPGPLEAARAAMADTEQRVRAALGEHVFGVDEETLAGAVLASAVSAGKRIATVESCTGGLLGAMMTEVPGSSAGYSGGWVTYSNRLKSELVGVPTDLIDAHGAVSEAVAVAMAEGGLRRAHADLCVSITGIAGPEGGTTDKPVGTVWIGVATPTGTSARRFVFPGSREDIRTRAARTALGLAHFALRGIEPGVFLWQSGPASPPRAARG